MCLGKRVGVPEGVVVALLFPPAEASERVLVVRLVRAPRYAHVLVECIRIPMVFIFPL